MKALNRKQTEKGQNMTAFWLTKDGNTHWGLPLSYRGTLDKAIRISKAFHDLDLPALTKAQIYHWRNFFPA